MAKNKKYLLAVLIISIILLLSSVGLVVWQVPYVVKDIHQECNEVMEPYTINEPYEVQENYIDYLPIKYDVLEKDYRDYFWTSGCDVWITIQNIDDSGGYFSVDFNVKTSKGNYETTSKEYFIVSGNSQNFVVSFEGDYKSSTYNVNYPEKEVMKIKTTTKYKPVTKYKQVTKCKNVEKEVTKYCNAWKKLLGMC